MDDTSAHISIPKDKLLEDLRLVMADAEDLLHATAEQAGEGGAAMRARIESRLHHVRESLEDAEAAVATRTRNAARATDHYVHEHPWQAIGISACIGALVGMLIARR